MKKPRDDVRAFCHPQVPTLPPLSLLSRSLRGTASGWFFGRAGRLRRPQERMRHLSDSIRAPRLDLRAAHAGTGELPSASFRAYPNSAPDPLPSTHACSCGAASIAARCAAFALVCTLRWVRRTRLRSCARATCARGGLLARHAGMLRCFSVCG